MLDHRGTGGAASTNGIPAIDHEDPQAFAGEACAIKAPEIPAPTIKTS
ncbi:hypothetical protein J2X71_004278 [Rhizobium sp. 1399]|jgi:hypothetical protein|nr:hypothetical protein [Rhizobium sp. 1399]